MIAIGALIPLAVLIGLVWGVVALARRFGTHETDGGTLRRVVTLLVLLAVAIIAATGVAQVLALLLPRGRAIADMGTGPLASALSLTVVGVPAFLLAWRFEARQLERREERRSIAWTLYLTLATLVFGIGSVVGLVNGLRWVAGAGPEAATALSLGFVWLGMWLWHVLVVASRYPAEQHPDAPAIAGSAIGLVTAAFGASALLSELLSAAYDSLFGSVVASSGFGDEIIGTALWFVAGAAVWWWQWLSSARRAEPDLLRNVYVLVLGVLGGAIAALTAIGGVIALLLASPFVDTSLTRHFHDVPSLLATGVIGWSVWRYHRAVTMEDPAVLRTETGRAYHYLLAGVGLIAASAGLGVVVNALLGGLVPAIDVTNVEQLLAGGLAALIVGAPVWWRTWRPRERPEVDEIRSTSRRAYLTVLAGVGSAVGLVSLIVFAYGLFDRLIAGAGAADVVDRVRAPFGVLAATGLVAWYHVRIWRDERELARPEHRGPGRLTIVTSAPESIDVAALHERLHARIDVLRRTDGDGFVGIDPEALAARLEGIDAGEAIVVAGPDDLEVIPVDRA